MRTVQLSVYKFSELSAEAKARAKQDHAEVMGYSRADEALESLKALAGHFGGKLTDWSIDYFAAGPSSASFDMPDMPAKEIASLLGQLGTYDRQTGKGHGDCKLTGFCADEDAIDGFRIAWRKGERDLGALMDAAFDSWLKAAQADCEDQFSDDTFSENCDANGYEFTADGEFYHEPAPPAI